MLTGRKRRNTAQIQRRHMPGRQRPMLCRCRNRTRFGTRFEKPNQSPRRTGSNPLSRMGGSTRRGSIMLAPYAPSAPSVCHPLHATLFFVSMTAPRPMPETLLWETLLGRLELVQAHLNYSEYSSKFLNVCRARGSPSQHFVCSGQ